MSVTDPSISRLIHEVESGVSQAPAAALDLLTSIDHQVLPREAQARLQLIRVRLLIELERFQEARSLLHETRKIINSQSDPELSAHSQLLLAHIKHQDCDPEGALKIYDVSLGLLYEEPLAPHLAEFLLHAYVIAAHSAIDLAQYSRAVSYIESGSRLAMRFGLDSQQARNAVSRLHLHLKMYSIAASVASQAVGLASSEAPFSYAHLMLARAYLASDQVERCLDVCSSGFMSVTHASLESKLRLLAGESFFKMGEHQVARGYLRESKEHARAQESERDVLKAHLIDSCILRTEGDYHAALRSIEEAMESPASHRLLHIRSRILSERAGLLSKLGRHQEASLCYDELFDLHFESTQLEEHAKMQAFDLEGIAEVFGVHLKDNPVKLERAHDRMDAQEILSQLTKLLGDAGGAGRGGRNQEFRTLEAELRKLIDQAGIGSDGESVAARTFKSGLLSVNATLTSTELKICALIREDHSSVQIAYKMDISVRTVDAHRRSIRKKLGLDPSDNLRSFLLKF